MATRTDNTNRQGATTAASKPGKEPSREPIVLSPEKVDQIEQAIADGKKWCFEERIVRSLVKTIRHVSSLGGLDDAPPHDLKLEREALAAIMCGSEQQSGLIITNLDKSDFYAPQHDELFSALHEAWERGEPFGTSGLLQDWIWRSSVLKDLAQRATVNEVARNCVQSVKVGSVLASYAEHYVKRLKDLTERRRLVVAAKCIVQQSKDRSRTTDELRDLLK